MTEWQRIDKLRPHMFWASMRGRMALPFRKTEHYHKHWKTWSVVKAAGLIKQRKDIRIVKRFSCPACALNKVWLWKNLYDGKRDRAVIEDHFGNSAQ